VGRFLQEGDEEDKVRGIMHSLSAVQSCLSIDGSKTFVKEVSALMRASQAQKSEIVEIKVSTDEE